VQRRPRTSLAKFFSASGFVGLANWRASAVGDGNNAWLISPFLLSNDRKKQRAKTIFHHSKSPLAHRFALGWK
jgi:hypothetical protein